MKLLVSPTDVKEAVSAIEGGADIIDVKNPQEGSLGAGFPWIIKNIKQIVPSNKELSCAIGDVPFLPATISLAAVGAATIGVDYIKVGIYGINSQEKAEYLMKNVVRSVKDINPSVRVVVCGYADAKNIGSINPLVIPKIAKESNCEIAMIDTAIKNGKNLFTFCSLNELKLFVDQSHEHGLKTALAGSLNKTDIPAIQDLGVDIVGVRGAACTDGDRVTGRISREKVNELSKLVK